MRLRERPLDPAVAADGHGDPAAGPPAEPAQRRSRKVVAIGLAVAVLAAAGLWSVLGGRSEGRDGDGGSTGPATATATAKISRQDLISRVEVDGTLGYEGELTVVNHKQGTVTSTATEGAVVERGGTLYRVENEPATLFYGDLPAWRDLAIGVPEGPDVRQLESNLVALGYASEDELTVDESFTSATASAVRRWQKAMDVEQTGAVRLGDAVFLPGAFRVASVKAAEGSSTPPGAPAMTGSGTTRVVTVDLDASKQGLVDVGDKVEVRLPGGRTTPGTIASVSSVARTKGQGQQATTVIPVTVSLDDPVATGTLDQAPVRVGITADTRRAVLAVPVNALLALSEGGYGLRVVEGASRRIVAVETGLFARGMVEVSADGLREGLDVEVPAS